MPLECIEIPIAMKQLVAAYDTARRKHNINCPAHGQAKTAKLSVVHSGLNSHVTATEDNKFKARKKPARFV